MSVKTKGQGNALIKPIQFAEQKLVISMLNGQNPPGTVLPGERELAQQIGVTRQTLREAIQRLAKDRWITVHHGRPTMVNDYWQKGGMGILNTVVDYARFLPPEFILHLLEMRLDLLPICAFKAITAMPEEFITFLGSAKALRQTGKAFAEFDKTLQEMMAKHSGNMVYRLFFNDYSNLLAVLSEDYFKKKKARAASNMYYAALAETISSNGDVAGLVTVAMEESIVIWKSFQAEKKKKS